MPYQRKLDEPGVMEAILEGIRNAPREYWLERLARYENEKPGDVILPGIPPAARSAAKTSIRRKPRKAA